MKKIFLMCSIICVMLLSVKSQEVKGTSGDYFQNAQASLSWTIGEPMTETYTTGTNILTQGFHQTGLTIVSIFELFFNNTGGYRE